MGEFNVNKTTGDLEQTAGADNVDNTVISATTNTNLYSDAWVKKCGSVVNIQLAGLKNVSADTTTELFTLDAKYRPNDQITIDGVIPNATTFKAYRLKVTTAGKVTIYLYGSSVESSQTNIQACATYVI